MIEGINHATLAVRDLGRSLAFYAEVGDPRRSPGMTSCQLRRACPSTLRYHSIFTTSPVKTYPPGQRSSNSRPVRPFTPEMPASVSPMYPPAIAT